MTSNKDKALLWLAFMAFTTGFVSGQDYHTGFWLVLRFLFQFVMYAFVMIVLIETCRRSYARKQEEQWRYRISQASKKPSNKGMGVSAASVARAIGTHVTVHDPEKSSPSSDDRKRPDAGFDR